MVELRCGTTILSEGQMGYSASRLTLYAVLSAIEDDLRQLIEDHLNTGLSKDDLFGADLHARACQRLSKDLGSEYQDATIADLLGYIDYADSFGLLNRHAARLPDNLAKYVRSITPRLEAAVPIRNRVAHGRPLHFDDLANMFELA